MIKRKCPRRHVAVLQVRQTDQASHRGMMVPCLLPFQNNLETFPPAREACHTAQSPQVERWHDVRKEAIEQRVRRCCAPRLYARVNNKSERQFYMENDGLAGL